MIPTVRVSPPGLPGDRFAPKGDKLLQGETHRSAAQPTETQRKKFATLDGRGNRPRADLSTDKGVWPGR